MTYFFDLREVGRKELAPGVTVKLVWGDKIMISMIEMAPYAIVPVHSHPHEQAGMVVHGQFPICSFWPEDDNHDKSVRRIVQRPQAHLPPEAYASTDMAYTF